MNHRLVIVSAAEVVALALSSGSHHQADNQAVQTQSLGEDEDEDHANEEAGLLSVGAHASIAHNANGKAGCQGAHADGEAGTEVRIAGVCRVGGCLHLAVDDNCCDQTVDTQHTSHDNWDDGSHHHVRSHDTHSRDANA